MRTYLRWLLGIALYVGCAQFTFLAFIQNPGNPDSFEKARLPELVAGTAHRPFVYRAVLPVTVRAILAVVPEGAEARLEAWAGEYRPLHALLEATPAADEQHPAMYLIAYALEWACLIGFALVLRAAIVHFYGAGPWSALLLPAGALLCLPVFYRYVSYDYDFPQLFLFSLGLLMLARQEWKWFYPVLVLGAFSKETTVLLVLIHVLGHAGRMPRRELAIHALVQLAIVVGARCLLQFAIFGDNPGVPAEKWWVRNWEMVSDPGRWGFLFFHFAWVGRTALVVPTNYNVLFLLLLPLVLWGWSAKPMLLRRGLWIIPVLGVLTFVMGYFDEMRDYYEAYPVVYLLISGTVCSLSAPSASDAEADVAGRRVRPLTAQRPSTECPPDRRDPQE
jgi:hypothetical protein